MYGQVLAVKLVKRRFYRKKAFFVIFTFFKNHEYRTFGCTHVNILANGPRFERLIN
jgi:hypothetical protein